MEDQITAEQIAKLYTGSMDCVNLLNAGQPDEESLTFFEDGLKAMLTQKTNQGLPWA